MQDRDCISEFTIGGDDYAVVRYDAPTTEAEWVALLGSLLDCGKDAAGAAYRAMLPDGYDRHGTGEVALKMVE